MPEENTNKMRLVLCKPGEGYFAGQPEFAGFSSDKPVDLSDEEDILRKICEVSNNNPEFDVMVRRFIGSAG